MSNTSNSNHVFAGRWGQRVGTRMPNGSILFIDKASEDLYYESLRLDNQQQTKQYVSQQNQTSDYTSASNSTSQRPGDYVSSIFMGTPMPTPQQTMSMQVFGTPAPPQVVIPSVLYGGPWNPQDSGNAYAAGLVYRDGYGNAHAVPIGSVTIDASVRNQMAAMNGSGQVYCSGGVCIRT